MTITDIRSHAAEEISSAALFANVEREALVPFASHERISPVQATIRAMHVDLGALKQKLGAIQPPMVTIYADTLSIPANTDWSIRGGGLAIIARRIEAPSGAVIHIDYRKNDGGVVLFTSEIAGSLSVVAITKDGPVMLPLTTGGAEVSIDGGKPVLRPLTYGQAIPISAQHELRNALRTEYLFASLLHDTHPQLAISMLRWICDWAGASSAMNDILLRSASLLLGLRNAGEAKSNGAAFVPYLSSTVYEELAQAFARDARQYEQDYRTLAAQKTFTGQSLELARRLARQQLHQSAYVDKVVDQARLNYEHAVAAVEACDTNVRMAQLKANGVKREFETVGVPAWRDAQIQKALIDFTAAGITFFIGVVGIFTGGGGGASAAETAIKTLALLEHSTGTTDKEIELLRVAKRHGERMQMLSQAFSLVGKFAILARSLWQIGKDVTGAASFARDVRDAGIGATAASAVIKWQMLQLETVEQLREPMARNIKYAPELKLAIDELALHGQAALTARLAAIEAGQRYADALLQKTLAQRQQQELESAVERFGQDEAATAFAMQQLLQRQLDAKSWLFSALQEYRASYAYWALRPSSVQPRILDSIGSVSDGLTELAKTKLDTAHALQSFRPAPQTLSSKSIVIDDAKVIESLRASGKASWHVPLDAPAFAGLQRVRLTRVRVWLEGAMPPAGGSVALTVTSDGTYLDRFQGATHRFVAQPLRRTFQYRVAPKRGAAAEWKFDDGTYGQVELDGAVDREVSYAYFEPTPFSQWQLEAGPGVDLSRVSRITMEVAGSVIS